MLTTACRDLFEFHGIAGIFHLAGAFPLGFILRNQTRSATFVSLAGQCHLVVAGTPAGHWFPPLPSSTNLLNGPWRFCFPCSVALFSESYY